PKVAADARRLMAEARTVDDRLHAIRGKAGPIDADGGPFNKVIEGVKSALASLAKATVNVGLSLTGKQPGGGEEGHASGGRLPGYASGGRHTGYRLPLVGPGTNEVDGVTGLDE